MSVDTARMPNSAPQPLPLDLLAPAEVRPNDVVVNIYPGADGQPDTVTFDGQVVHMHERYQGRAVTGPEPIMAMVPVPDLQEVPSRSPSFLFSPEARRWIMAGALGATILANLVHNAGSIAADVKDLALKARDSIVSLFQPNKAILTPIEHRPITIQGSSQEVQSDYTEMHVGTANADPNNVQTVLNSYEQAIANGQSVDEIVIIGDASDDWEGGVSSLGKSDKGNDELAKQRADEFKQALQKAAAEAGVELPPITTDGKETVLDDLDRRQLNDVSRQFGMTYQEDYTAYNNNPSDLPLALRQLFTNLIGQHRGVDVRFVAKAPDQVIYRTHPLIQQAVDTPPTHENHPYDLELWPLLGMLLAAAPGWRTTKEIVTGFKPMLIAAGQIPQYAWTKLYPEAFASEAEDALVLEAYAYLRSVQIAMRDERIKGVMRHDYTDVEGMPQSIRVMFLDHETTEATRAAFEKQLETISHLQGGILGNRLHAIMVVPDTNTGRKHGDHKRIGIGGDQQYDSRVLGRAVPVLGYAEMQMPVDPTEEQLNSFHGAMGTLMHEVAGHFTGLDDEAPTLKRTGHPSERRYTVRTPWTGVGQAALSTFKPIDAPGKKRFLVDRHIVDLDGNVLPSMVLEEGDPRLSEADRTYLLDRLPSGYSDTSGHELHSEVAAEVAGGLAIPYSEADVVVPKIPGFRFAAGYMADPSLRQAYADVVGAEIGEDGQLLWDYEPNGTTTYGPILEDPELGPIAAKARATPLTPDDELIKILTAQVA